MPLPVTEQQWQLVDNLKTELSLRQLTVPPEMMPCGSEPATLIRFLRARKFDVMLAADMLEASLQWRIDNNASAALHTRLDDRTEAILEKEMPAGYIGYTKEGCPLKLEHTTKINVMSLLDEGVDIENVMFFNMRNMELLVRVRFPEAAKLHSKEVVDQQSIIMDLKGLSMKMLNSTFYSVFSRLAKMYQDNYPEIMCTMFLVNVPSFFHIIWRMLSAALDDRVKRKIFFLRSRDLAVLKDFISGDQLPRSLGGYNDSLQPTPTMIAPLPGRCHAVKEIITPHGRNRQDVLYGGGDGHFTISDQETDPSGTTSNDHTPPATPREAKAGSVHSAHRAEFGELTGSAESDEASQQTASTPNSMTAATETARAIVPLNGPRSSEQASPTRWHTHTLCEVTVPPVQDEAAVEAASGRMPAVDLDSARRDMGQRPWGRTIKHLSRRRQGRKKHRKSTPVHMHKSASSNSLSPAADTDASVTREDAEANMPFASGRPNRGWRRMLRRSTGGDTSEDSASTQKSRNSAGGGVCENSSYDSLPSTYTGIASGRREDEVPDTLAAPERPINRGWRRMLRRGAAESSFDEAGLQQKPRWYSNIRSVLRNPNRRTQQDRSGNGMQIQRAQSCREIGIGSMEHMDTLPTRDMNEEAAGIDLLLNSPLTLDFKGHCNTPQSHFYGDGGSGSSRAKSHSCTSLFEQYGDRESRQEVPQLHLILEGGPREGLCTTPPKRYSGQGRGSNALPSNAPLMTHDKQAAVGRECRAAVPTDTHLGANGVVGTAPAASHAAPLPGLPPGPQGWKLAMTTAQLCSGRLKVGHSANSAFLMGFVGSMAICLALIFWGDLR